MTMSAERTVVPFDSGFGAELRGVDLVADDSQETADWVKEQLIQNAVVVLHGQDMSAADIARFGRQLGRIEKHAFQQYRHEDVEEVSYVTNRDKDGNVDPFGVRRAEKWHFDESYKNVPPQLTLLHALQVPKVKGGTEFADVRAAYDTMPPALATKVKDLVSVFRVRVDGEPVEAHHPTVYTHPRSGRKVLLISPQHQVGFEGMENEEGLEVMNEILEWAVQPKFRYYHNWVVGDVLLWDQTQTLHRNPVDSDPNEPRIFLRTIVQ
jgi:alpha-ketoglutarate-dependent taurine dioxygenase